MCLQNSYRFARQYLLVSRSWVLLVISLSSSTFQCASPISRLDIFASNIESLRDRNNILVYVIYISYGKSLIFCTVEGHSLYFVLYILALETRFFTAASSWNLRKCEHRIILISTEINNTLTISIAYK